MAHIPEAINYGKLGFPVIYLMTFILIAIMFVVSILAVIKFKKIPSGYQNFAEIIFEFLTSLVDSIMGKNGKDYYWLFIGLFLFIFIGNAMGLIPGLISPTANLNTTIALAAVVFFSTHIIGIFKHGPVKYIASLTGDVPAALKPFMFLIELISHMARPLSLSFRLFGNMYAKEMLLSVLAMLVIMFLPSSIIFQRILSVAPILLLPFVYLLGMIVVFIQAFVFTILSIFYINGAVVLHGEEHK